MASQNEIYAMNSQQRKLFWSDKKRTLKELLYNEKNGDTEPRNTDVAQQSTGETIFDMNDVISDCYLLALLMSVARKHPDRIKKLIKVKSDNRVDIGFHGLTAATSEDKSKIKYKFKPTSKIYNYSVTKDEALNWKTYHKALWPVVIEIAYAKHIQAVHSGDIKHHILYLLKLDRKLIPNNSKSLKDLLNFGVSSITNAEIFGESSVQEVYLRNLDPSILRQMDKDTVDEIIENSPKFRKFKYSPESDKIFDKIKTKIDQGLFVTATFKKSKNNDIFIGDSEDGLSIKVYEHFIKLHDSKKLQESKIKKYYLKGYEERQKWLEANGIPSFDGLFVDRKVKNGFKVNLLNFISLFIDLRKYTQNHLISGAVSKTKTGVYGDHVYAVVAYVEKDGYKYLILRNPHDTRTKIDYTKSKKLPRTVRLPVEMSDNLDKNECMMELNHFCKYLLGLGYGKSGNFKKF